MKCGRLDDSSQFESGYVDKGVPGVHGDEAGRKWLFSDCQSWVFTTTVTLSFGTTIYQKKNKQTGISPDCKTYKTLVVVWTSFPRLPL
jgi:hypothetical protein